ncbi:MAG: hypothetical protein QM763_04740 [Agriterribacter sp.]
MRKFLLLALCIPGCTLYAQSKKFQFKTGSEYELPKRTQDLTFLGNEKDGIVNLSVKREALYITQFNPQTLTQTDERVVNIPEATGNMMSETAVHFGNNFYWIRSDWNRDQRKELLYATAVDVKKGKLNDKYITLIEANKLGVNRMRTDVDNDRQYSKYQFNFDADQKRLLVSYRLAPEIRNDKNSYDRLGIHVFDENLQKIWGNEFTMPYTEKRMDNLDYAVDANGNGYLLAKVYNSEDRKEKDKSGNPDYQLEVFKFSNNKPKPEQAKISLNEYFIQEASLLENTFHEMIIACTYSKSAKNKSTEGVFLGVLNSGEIGNYKKGYYRFPVEELQKFETNRKRRKIEKDEEYEIPNLQVRNIIVEKDGSIFIACEEEYFNVRTTGTSSSGYSTKTIYYYEDILGIKIDAAGNFIWMRKVPKKQKGTNTTETLGFKLISDETGYYFLYLDNKKNEHIQEDETPATHVAGFGGQVMVSKIDNNGTITKELIFDTRDEDIMITPKQFKKINNNQFIGRAKIRKTLFKPVLITMN